MNDFKNIMESYESQVAPKWDKNKNWAKISNKISTASNPKSRNANLILFLMMAVLFSIIGFFMGKTYSDRQRAALNQNTTNIKENIIHQKDAITIDTFFIIKRKTDTIYKIKTDKKLQNISLEAINKPSQNEFTSSTIDTANLHKIDYTDRLPIVKMISNVQQDYSDSLATIVLSISEKNTRTKKKYAETVIFKDNFKKPKHDFKFMNHVPNFNSITSKYAHGQ